MWVPNGAFSSSTCGRLSGTCPTRTDFCRCGRDAQADGHCQIKAKHGIPAVFLTCPVLTPVLSGLAIASHLHLRFVFMRILCKAMQHPSSNER